MIVIFRLLNSPHFVLRKSSVSCLRQFAQKEAKAVFMFAAAENAYVAQGVINLNRQFGEFVWLERAVMRREIPIEIDLILA